MGSRAWQTKLKIPTAAKQKPKSLTQHDDADDNNNEKIMMTRNEKNYDLNRFQIGAPLRFGYVLCRFFIFVGFLFLSVSVPQTEQTMLFFFCWEWVDVFRLVPPPHLLPLETADTNLRFRIHKQKLRSKIFIAKTFETFSLELFFTKN